MVSLAPDNLQLVVQGVDRAFYHKTWEGQNDWKPSRFSWNNIGGAFLYEPVVAVWGTSLFVFGIGLDSALYWRKYDGQKWTADWESLGGSWVSKPGVTVQYPNWLELVVIGQDRSLYQYWYSDKGWSGSSGFGGSMKFINTPFLTSWEGRMDIFCASVTGNIYHKWWTEDQGWGPNGTFQDIGSPFYTQMSAVSWGPNRIDLFGMGDNSTLFQRTFNGSWWSGSWIPVGTVYRGIPEVVSWGPNRIDLFAIGVNSTLYHKSYTQETGWTSTNEDIGESIVNDRVTAVSWGSGRIDLMILGKTSETYHKSYTIQGGWSPPESGFNSIGGHSISRVAKNS